MNFPQLKIVFGNFIRTYETIIRLESEIMMRNNKKALEGFYRRLQVEPQINKQVLLYYNNIIERKRRILLAEPTRSEPHLKKPNPYIRRFQNFEVNKFHRTKIEMSQFI